MPITGPGLIFLFVAFSALRDVYFGKVFQALDFFEVILLAFSICTLAFLLVARVRARGDMARLRGDFVAVIGMNVATAIAWICYFCALKYIEPSVASTLFMGVGPLIVVGLGAVGIHIAAPSRAGRAEIACYVGIVAALALTAWITLSGRSGLGAAGSPLTLVGLLLAIIGGTSITVSNLFTKRLHEQGVSADAVLATRFIAIVAVAAGVEAADPAPIGINTPESLAVLALAAIGLMVLPVYANQLGIARTSPLTAQVIRALGPVMVFAAQHADDRIAYSSETLAAVLLYSGFAIAGNLARALHSRSRPGILGKSGL